MTREDLESAHKKALKALDGEKRAAIKKVKGTKGKKAKEAVTAAEEEFDTKLKDLEEKYKQRMAELEGEQGLTEIHPEAATEAAADNNENDDDGDDDDEEAKGLSAKERKQLKARRKKERQKEREAERQAELERETANAGPSMRQVELEQMQAVLTPLDLKIGEVDADGHCLYRAVAAQTGRSYNEMRELYIASQLLSISAPNSSTNLHHSVFSAMPLSGRLCADALIANQDDFAPFCEYTDDIASFDQYVERVRNSAEWGGHLELRALGQALDRPIQVYSLQSGSKPLSINDERNDEKKKPIRLSYHLHYYALGEHYNQVLEKGSSP